MNKKMLMKMVSFLLTAILVVSPSVVKAEGKVRDIDDSRVRVTAENVSEHESWSEYRRISDNLDGYPGDEIKATSTETFSVEVSGDLFGLGISVGQEIESSREYTLRLPYRGTFYLACRTKNKIIRGDRVVRTASGGVFLRKSRFEVIYPLYLEYKLMPY